MMGKKLTSAAAAAKAAGRKGPDWPSVKFHLPRELLDRVDEWAQREERTRSSFIRWALGRVLARLDQEGLNQAAAEWAQKMKENPEGFGEAMAQYLAAGLEPEGSEDE